MNNKKIKNIRSFDKLIEHKYGKIGTPERDQFEEKARYFIISEMLKAARREANLTQEQLADKIGTKKTYISRIENGNCDIQISTLYRIFEVGLGKKINFVIT